MTCAATSNIARLTVKHEREEFHRDAPPTSIRTVTIATNFEWHLAAQKVIILYCIERKIEMCCIINRLYHAKLGMYI